MLYTFTEQDRVRMKVQDMIDQGREKKNSRSPLVTSRSDQVVELIGEVKRKGAMNNEKKYNQIRERFLQNYDKLHPNKPRV